MNDLYSRIPPFSLQVTPRGMGGRPGPFGRGVVLRRCGPNKGLLRAHMQVLPGPHATNDMHRGHFKQRGLVRA